MIENHSNAPRLQYGFLEPPGHCIGPEEGTWRKLAGLAAILVPLLLFERRKTVTFEATTRRALSLSFGAVSAAFLTCTACLSTFESLLGSKRVLRLLAAAVTPSLCDWGRVLALLVGTTLCLEGTWCLANLNCGKVWPLRKLLL